MIGLIDNWIEKISKPILHQKRDYYIEKYLTLFKGKHTAPPETYILLETRLNTEANRIYPIVDQSILRERIKRAKLTFWLTGITSTLTVALLGGFKTHAVLPFITPPITAAVTWAISLVTIPISYHHRIKGAMHSTCTTLEKELNEQQSTACLHHVLHINPTIERSLPQENIALIVEKTESQPVLDHSDNTLEPQSTPTLRL